MIFVTVGTWQFDQLIETIDKLVKDKVIKEDVICQIANGKYIPKYVKSFFKLKPSIDNYIKEASLVVTHGGVGSVFSVLQYQKPLIAVSNPNVADRHQDELLKELSKENYLIWCSETESLHEVFNNLKAHINMLRPYIYTNRDLIDDIISFIEQD